MNLDWTPDQRARFEAIARFAKSDLRGDSQRSPESVDRERWLRAARFGLAGLPIPGTWGGADRGPLDTIHALEALGYGCDDAGFVFALCAHTFACALPVLQFGSEQQRVRYLPRLCDGRLIGANAASEAEAGSDIFAMRTSARRVGDGYVLDGEKAYVTNVGLADVFLVYANLDPEFGLGGLTAFVVERTQPGVEIGPNRDKIGLRTVSFGALRLRGCELSSEQRIGGEGAGALVFAESMRWERACLFAFYVGIMQRTFEQCLEHAKQRRQFGQPIGRFQLVSERLVDMKIRLESSRWLSYNAGWQLQNRRRCDLDASLSKLLISESAVQSGLDAVQIHGALGCLMGSPAAETLLDAIPARVFSGTSEMQRMVIAKALGL